MSLKIEARRKSKRKSGKATRTTVHKTAFAVVLGIATLLGGVVAALTFLPRISCEQNDPVDPTNSMSASFTIANNNFVPLQHVYAAIGIGQIRAGNPSANPMDPNITSSFATRIDLREWQDHYLGMDDRFTITPWDVLQSLSDKWDEAYIAIIVTYHPWILPWTREKIFRFRTHRLTDGKLHWYAVPPN
jgi:hypothetical protein